MQNKSQCSSDKLSAKQPINASELTLFAFSFSHEGCVLRRGRVIVLLHRSLLFLIKTPASGVHFPQKGCGERRQL
jgi:hypothetical protein